MAVPRNGSRPHASLDLESDADPKTPRGWIFSAPCGDMPGAFDVPEQLTGDALEIWARPLLAICVKCPFRQECIEHVDPRASHNNIVSGGIVWRKGSPVAFRGRSREERDARGGKPSKPCGTVAAYKRHQYWSEDICEACRAAFREDANRRNRDARERKAAS